MQLLRVGAVAKLLNSLIPGIKVQQVREWCDAGLLRTFKNPSKRFPQYKIYPDSIKEFLLKDLGFTHLDIERAFSKIAQEKPPRY